MTPRHSPRWRIALSRVLWRPWLVLMLWLLSLGSAAVAALPAGLSLYATLAERPAAVKLARGQADVLRSELFFVDGGSSAFGPMLLGSLFVGVVLFWLVQALLSGGIVAALLRPGHPAHAPPGRILIRAVETGFAMLRLELFGLFALRLPLCMLIGAGAYVLTLRPELLELSPQALVVRFAPLAVLFFWLWSATSVVLHYARMLRLDGGAELSTGAALQGGLQLATRSRRGLSATLGLGLVSILGYGLLLGLGHLAAAALDQALYVGTAFVVRQLFALVRAVLSLFIIAGATEVFHDLSGPRSARTPSSGL